MTDIEVEFMSRFMVLVLPVLGRSLPQYMARYGDVKVGIMGHACG